MSLASLKRELASTDPDACASGLRRLTRYCGTDSVTEQRPPDIAQRRAELGDVEPRLLELAQSPDEVLRELAADALGAWLGAAALETLMTLAADPVERVRASAIGALEGWPHETRAQHALLYAVHAGRWTIRMRAARALRHFQDDEVDGALLEALVDPDSYVRLSAADSLRRRASAPYLERLRALRDYPAPHLLDAALDLLGAVGTPEDLPLLDKTGSWLNLSQPGHVRSWARKAARHIRQRQKAQARASRSPAGG